MIFEGLLNLSAWACIGITLVLTHITIASVTIFLHRHQAHRALTLHPVVSHFFRFWLWLTTGMVTQEWVAVHRKHHAKCETPEDPHSPQTRGLATVLFGGVGLYRREAENPETMHAYGRGTPDDWIEQRVYARFRYLGLGLMLGLDAILFGWVGLIIFAVQMLWIPFWAAGVINGVGHYFGYRNFETQDASRNIFPIGLLIGGEELHNNHHAYRQSARLSNKVWEFDVGWLYIRLLERAGLARVQRAAPKTVFLPSKSSVDLDTLQAVIRNRFHVLRLYTTRVIRPVLRRERIGADAYARKQLRRLRKLMSRAGTSLDAAQRQMLDSALQASKTLRTVHEFKRQLKSLLQPSATDAARLARLQAWCAQAEATGIEALREFAEQLRGYGMRTA
jgi:stearoyl-CoA desaturase (delta-9 desaturase)